MAIEFLQEHLNVWWLRPLSALCDAVLSFHLEKQTARFVPPILEIGSGNGIFSFITAGGRFSHDFDWFLTTDSKNSDIYDTFDRLEISNAIIQRPKYQIDCAFDHKQNLLLQAMRLGFYTSSYIGNANEKLPFSTGQFQTVFSNILYWLDDLDFALQEIHRVLRPNGQAILYVLDKKFPVYCKSYQWETLSSEWLRRLNEEQSSYLKWFVTREEIETKCHRAGFQVEFQQNCLSEDVLRMWDSELRPVSRQMIKMANRLDSATRKEIKRETVSVAYDLLLPLFQTEIQERDDGGWQLLCLRR